MWRGSRQRRPSLIAVVGVSPGDTARESLTAVEDICWLSTGVTVDVKGPRRNAAGQVTDNFEGYVRDAAEAGVFT